MLSMRRHTFKTIWIAAGGFHNALAATQINIYIHQEPERGVFLETRTISEQ